jgi:hypothetical protein
VRKGSKKKRKGSKKMRGQCVMQETKKYITRKSPSYSANACKGQIMVGNDSMLYESVPDKNKVYRWKKL